MCLPQYLGQVQGYNAEQIGAVPRLDRPAAAPADPRCALLMRRFDARHIGFVGIALSRPAAS